VQASDGFAHELQRRALTGVQLVAVPLAYVPPEQAMGTAVPRPPHM
jgi:hypothetical protein